MNKVLATTALGAMLAVSVSAMAQLNFAAALNGGQENPPINTSSWGYGSGLLTGGPGSYVFTYSVNYQLNSPLRDAHIHNGAVGTNGPVVHGLDGLAANLTTLSGSFSGDWRFDDATRPLTDTLAMSLMNNGTYFNIHTDANRGGEIRGQLIAVPEPGSVALLLGLSAMGLSFVRKSRRK